jgi:hypothetical protein
MGIHDLISEVEAAAGLVKEWLTEIPTSPELPAGPSSTAPPPARKPCTRTAGCELADEHAEGCQLEGKFTADAPKATP